MKLRFRDSTGEQRRVEIPVSARLKTLEKLLADLFCMSCEDFKISLNKKDVISGDSNTPLHELGLRSGDTLYLIDAKFIGSDKAKDSTLKAGGDNTTKASTGKREIVSGPSNSDLQKRVIFPRTCG